jgi:hypothetical protein
MKESSIGRPTTVKSMSQMGVEMKDLFTQNPNNNVNNVYDVNNDTNDFYNQEN